MNVYTVLKIYIGCLFNKQKEMRQNYTQYFSEKHQNNTTFTSGWRISE